MLNSLDVISSACRVGLERQFQEKNKLMLKYVIYKSRHDATMSKPTFSLLYLVYLNSEKNEINLFRFYRGGTHLSEGLTGLAEKTKEQTIKQ